MAPTVTAAMGYSKEHMTLAIKLRKPIVEKMRRDRINSSIEQLRQLLDQQPDSKLEKADILEMTVCYLRRHSQRQPVSAPSGPSAESEGYSRCVQEIKRFLSQDGTKVESQGRLLNHFQNTQLSLDKSSCQSVLPQLSSPVHHTTIKGETQANTILWRPW
ncbi:transcription factor HES-5-like [Lepisosteus oculatus]|uniref:transcription factor HES-5-like n=1 Tax=Lepisosteus oculatus TaxID=7918 RepID=UPI00073FD6FB|nr:PREDICTED: transcription factor HES-5-like [Lepisosteus oculatus]